MGDPVNAAQQRAEQGNEIRNARQHLIGVKRQRALGQVVAETKIVEADGRQQQHGCPAHFGLAEDVVQIGVRVVVDALLGFFQQLVAIAELGGAGGADFRASRLFAGSHALAAHDAFAHAGNGFFPFILGHAKRAGRHAIAASHALALVVGNRAESRFLQRADGADRSAGRVVAVHAQLAHELVVLGQDGSVFVGRRYLLGRNLIVVRQAVFGGAGLFALLAADALGGIVEDSFAHELSPGP